MGVELLCRKGVNPQLCYCPSSWSGWRSSYEAATPGSGSLGGAAGLGAAPAPHTYRLLSGRTRTQTATAPSSAIPPGSWERPSAARLHGAQSHPALKFKFSQTPPLIERGPVTSRAVPLASWCGGREAAARPPV